MKKILAQAKKEFRLFRRDKLLVMLAVLMPAFSSFSAITGSAYILTISR